MNRYLIALDLDGTLLYDWETLEESTRDYLASLKAAGHVPVIATGRPYRSSVRYHRTLGLNSPMINYNGGLITWRNNPSFEEVNIRLEKDVVLDVFTAMEPHIYNAFCEIKDDIYLLRKTDNVKDLLHLFGDTKLHVGDFRGTLPSGTNGFIIIARKHEGHLIEEYVRNHHAGKARTRNWGDDYQFIIELYTPLTNKGRALEHVATHMGFEQANIIAFGDGMNDIEMLEYAGTGVAMKNAPEEVKAAADLVSPFSHEERAVERYLKEHFKKVGQVRT